MNMVHWRNKNWRGKQKNPGGKISQCL